MSLKPKRSIKIRIRKFKTEDRNENWLKSEYEGYIKIRNPLEIYLKIRNPSEKNSQNPRTEKPIIDHLERDFNRCQIYVLHNTKTISFFTSKTCQGIIESAKNVSQSFLHQYKRNIVMTETPYQVFYSFINKKQSIEKG